jgi:hypothetical protein
MWVPPTSIGPARIRSTDGSLDPTKSPELTPGRSAFLIGPLRPPFANDGNRRRGEGRRQYEKRPSADIMNCCARPLLSGPAIGAVNSFTGDPVLISVPVGP